MQSFSRRQFLQSSAAVATTAGLPFAARAQERSFDPQPGAWRTFEVTTRVEVLVPSGATRVWLPVPSIDSEWQQSLESSFASNGQAQLTSDGKEGARILYAEFPATGDQPWVELTSRVRTRNRSASQRDLDEVLSPQDRQYWTRATHMLPTDGIVRSTAVAATRGARTDEEKVRRVYDWVVANTYREPKVRGCGEGDIKTMLETGNLGGKCADLNAIFVGLCRSVGVPARDIYGLRLAPSAFGYKELSGNPSNLSGAQHCRSEVFLQGRGWVAMDPADVAKVMRLETPTWIKTTHDPVVGPVNRALFGGWEGNWVGWNNAHDVKLPNARGERLGFFMYPMAEDAQGRRDPYSPDDFQYRISARELKV
ncbi:MAG TPA: transglutaminase domain-containing protein [Ramlibacter sp.]|nr:transglutaminase domain-containing protein [Ramlibacter sp.]